MRTLLLVAAAVVAMTAASSASAAQPYPLDFHTFDLSGGTTSGLSYSKGALSLASTRSLATAPYSDHQYARATGWRWNSWPVASWWLKASATAR